jgi:putative SOS response-associated peptidase YedK
MGLYTFLVEKYSNEQGKACMNISQGNKKSIYINFGFFIKPINARYETLQEKSMFDVSKNRRCVIVAEG